MTLQQLRYFLAAADHGSFSAAAESLLLAQPSLSDQIRRLEAELGVALFVRAGRRLVLTDAGRTLRPHAEATLREAEEAADSVKQVRTLAGGTVSFGTFGSAHHSLLGGLVEEFRRAHPDVRVRVVGQNSVEVADAVREGRLEAGLIALPVDDSALEVRPAVREENHYVSADPARVRAAQDDRGARRRAADPLRRALGAGRPAAPAARRARAARGRPARARDRGGVPDRGARPRGARAGRHDLRAERAGDPRLRREPAQRAARSAALRQLRVHHAAQRAALAGDPRVPGARRAARRRDRDRRARGYDQGMSHDQATVAEEEYLQTIFWLQEAGLPMTGANVARAMQLSAPTVHEMIGRLERDGYVTRGADKALSFTDDGREHAEGIVRRHRLIERFLTDVLGIPWDEVHEEAERLEHAMSPVLEERMLAAIGDAKTCPHGHPIYIGDRLTGVPLGDVEEGASVRILRFENEAEDLLHYLKDSGIEPGLEGSVTEADDEHIVVTLAGRPCEISRSVAETVSVIADPSPPARTALPEQLVLSKDRYGR